VSETPFNDDDHGLAPWPEQKARVCRNASPKYDKRVGQPVHLFPVARVQV
jgi:hypothetical protein